MRKFTRILTNLTRNSAYSKSTASGFIFYKVVESSNDYQFILQCINSQATFQISISNLVLDLDILYGLHPTQSCFIGIEYAKFLKSSYNQTATKCFINEKFRNYETFRYGKYLMTHIDRKGNIGFNDTSTQQQYIMDPRDVALSEETIQQFDAAQAFHIGILAGFKLSNPTTTTVPNKKPHLRVVK